MARVFLMSPPPPGWRIVGGANYKSVARAAVNPRKALAEWMALADAIVAQGAEVAVLPPSKDSLLTGLIYTANAGWLISPSRFRIARLSVAHRQAELAYLETALKSFKLTLEASRAVWEGQADMCWLDADKCILTYGVRSTPESVDEVRATELKWPVSWHAAKLQNPYFHGDTCMMVLQAAKGRLWVAFPGAFASADEYRDARKFAEQTAEVLEITEADALGYACNSLQLGRVLLGPTGLSSALVSELGKRGIELRPMDFGELFGKGGGGPRCLVNELWGWSELKGPESYRSVRAELLLAEKSYPTSA